MKNYVPYKGGLIARNSTSTAFQLWEAKKFKELDAHIAELRAAAIKRGEIRP